MTSQPLPALVLDGATRSANQDAQSTVHRGRLFRKYLLLILSLVTGAMLASGAFWIWSSHQDSKAALASLQHEKALAAAARIEQYITGIEQQLSTRRCRRSAPSDVELRRIEFLKLLRQVPEVTDIAPAGRAPAASSCSCRASAMDSVNSGKDRSQEPAFHNATRARTWFGPVYFRKETEPYMTIARALGQRRGTGDDRRRQPEVHLGRRVAHQDRRQGQGVRRRRQRLSRSPIRTSASCCARPTCRRFRTCRAAHRRRASGMSTRCSSTDDLGGIAGADVGCADRAAGTGRCSSSSR